QLLNNIDCLISLKEKQNRTLELTAQALFKHWFVDFEFPNEDGKPYKSSGGQMVDSELGEIPEGWEINRIGDLCSKVTKGTTPTSVGGKFSDIGVNFIKVESLTDEGGFVPSKFAHIDEYSNKLLKRSQLDPGDILISIAGTIGRVALVTEEILPANTNQALAILRVEGKWRAFLKYALTDSTVRNKLLENVVEAVQANLSLGIISNTQMVTPNSKTLLCFDSVAENLLAKINLNNKMITNLSKLRDLLLPKLISGEIRLAA
ncbi:MAG: restriction endonuclease subunit S, partial [Bdellovibrionales bacterium]|nr:restriction endonuclease subunit S [Bdellovibrionales bacterium]